MNFLIKKKPGDGTITDLKASLQKTGASLLLLEVVGETFDQNFGEKVADHVRNNPESAINIVIDLTQASSPARWASAISEVVINGKIGDIQLPTGSQTVTVVRDDPVIELPTFFLTRSVHVARDQVKGLSAMIESHQRTDPHRSTVRSLDEEPGLGR